MTHTHSTLPLTNISSLIQFPLLRYPTLINNKICIPFPHLVYTSLFHLLKFYILVSHYTDTPIYIFPLVLVLSTIINNEESDQFGFLHDGVCSNKEWTWVEGV